MRRLELMTALQHCETCVKVKTYILFYYINNIKIQAKTICFSTCVKIVSCQVARPIFYVQVGGQTRWCYGQRQPRCRACGSEWSPKVWIEELKYDSYDVLICFGFLFWSFTHDLTTWFSSKGCQKEKLCVFALLVLNSLCVWLGEAGSDKWWGAQVFDQTIQCQELSTHTNQHHIVFSTYWSDIRQWFKWLVRLRYTKRQLMHSMRQRHGERCWGSCPPSGRGAPVDPRGRTSVLTKRLRQGAFGALLFGDGARCELHEPKKKSGENRLRGDCKVWMKPSCATWNDYKRTKDQTIMKQSCNPLVKDFFHRSSQMYLLNRQIASAQHEDLGWKFKPNRYFSFSMHLRFLCLGSPWRSSTEATIGVDLACWDLNWMIIAEFQPGAKCQCKIYL